MRTLWTSIVIASVLAPLTGAVTIRRLPTHTPSRTSDSPDRWILTGRFEGEALACRGEFDYLGKHVQFRSETRPSPGGGFTLTEFASADGGPEQLMLVGRAERMQ